MNTTIVRALLAATLVASAPLAASADATVGGPIQLNNVTIQPSAGWRNSFAYPGLTAIAFTNHNTSPATDIVFALHGARGQVLGQIEDAGTYAQGQTIRHTFTDNYDDPDQYLTVEQATFADGSVWTNPGAYAPVSRRQAN